MKQRPQTLRDAIAQDPDKATALIDEVLRAQFHWFYKRCFTTLNPGTEYLDNWHIRAIAWHLEQARQGKIKRLIISMPPRSGKSLAASIAFPAFIHGHDPSAKIIAVSYSQSLATDLHNDYRTIINSEGFRRMFPQTRVSSRKYTEQEVRFTKHGMRYATSVGGSLTGRGADFIIIDDLIKPIDALSATLRASHHSFYDNTLLSRLNNKNVGVIIIVTQRLHVDDLVGHVTENDDSWTHLVLPAIANEEQIIPIGDGRIYRRAKGELLHPARESQAVLDGLKQTMGSEAFEAQYQQCPVPPGGNLIKREWLSYYDELPEPGTNSIVFQSWDTASKTSTANDWSVCTTWLYHEGRYYLLDVFRQKLSYPDLRAKMLELERDSKPLLVLIEDAGVATGLLEELVREGINAIGIAPREAKETRAAIQTPKFQSGRVMLPRKAPWLSALEAELLAFPAGRHDDQVDSITQALAFEQFPSVDFV